MTLKSTNIDSCEVSRNIVAELRAARDHGKRFADRVAAVRPNIYRLARRKRGRVRLWLRPRQVNFDKFGGDLSLRGESAASDLQVNWCE